MKHFGIWAAIMLILGSILFLSCGCAAAKAQPKPVPNPVLTHPGQTPPALKSVSIGLDWIIILAVLAVGVGGGLFFFCPIAHRISFAIMGTAAAVEGSALVTRVSLWFIPWIAIGLGVLAIGFAIYEGYRNRKKLFGDLNDSSGLVQSSTLTAAPFPVQLTHS